MIAKRGKNGQGEKSSIGHFSFDINHFPFFRPSGSLGSVRYTLACRNVLRRRHDLSQAQVTHRQAEAYRTLWQPGGSGKMGND